LGVTSALAATQRPISDFVSRQGTYCPKFDASGNPLCAEGCYPGPNCPGTDCFLYIPPFPNFLDWTDPKDGTSVSVDYAGLFNAYLGNRFGTTTSGSITEVPQADGSVIEIIVLHTVNAVTWASVGFSGTGPVLFGANEPQVAAGAAPSLGSSTLRVVLKGPGGALPDLIELLSGCGPWSFVALGFVAQANGTLPDGSPGMVKVTQTGLLTTAGLANPNSRVALDAFPAENIVIRPTGSQ
jgi:hypothetical protein